MTKEEKIIMKQFEIDVPFKNVFWNGKLTKFFKDYTVYMKKENRKKKKNERN